MYVVVPEEVTVGTPVGDAEDGWIVGDAVVGDAVDGIDVGDAEGREVGNPVVGDTEEGYDGKDVGDFEGREVGTPVGALDAGLSGRHALPFSEIRIVA